MLFRDFFPRLRDRAWQRYGQVVTERQFTGWREDGLLPGPAAPIGRGRGRSPERHWPTASYRRALRICRYKSWGAGRKSQWWLALWLSGEDISPEIIRSSLKRECSIDRRKSRHLAQSNRWRVTEFQTIKDIAPKNTLKAEQLEKTLGLIGATPDQHRRLCNAEVGDSARGEYLELVKELSPGFFDMSAGEASSLSESMTPVSFSRVRRSGRVSATRNHIASHYADALPDPEVQMVRELFWLSLYEAHLLMLLLIRQGEIPVERIALLGVYLAWAKPQFADLRNERILQFAFELNADRRDGKVSGWRVNGAKKRIRRLQRLIIKVANQNRLKTSH